MNTETNTARDTERFPVSVIVPTRNEEENIRPCLNSVAWADEVFVVDSNSRDRTADMAREMGAQVVPFTYDGGWPKKKNWALRNLPIRNEWVLILDADERVTAELRDEIGGAIRSADCDGFYIRWKFIFLGRWMKHSWNHGWMLRLIRRGRGEYEDLGMRDEGGWDTEVHENIVVSGKSRCLRSYLLHESEKDLSYWIAKQNDFSEWNAAIRLTHLKEPLPPIRDSWSQDPLKRRRWLKAFYLRLPGKPLLMFLYLYIFRIGFLDGVAGFYFCALRAMHELNISAKIYERRISTR